MSEVTQGGGESQTAAEQIADLFATVAGELGGLLAAAIDELRADLDKLTAELREVQAAVTTEREG